MYGRTGMFDGLLGVGTTALVIVVALLAMGMILMRLYVRASNHYEWRGAGLPDPS